MEPEDACLWVYDTDGKHTIAFTDWQLENLRELRAEHKRSGPPPRS
jgi:subtilisin-like proprotein convertase family protein